MIPSASTSASLRLNLVHFLPNYFQGLFARRPRRVALLSRLDLDRRTVRLVEQLKHEHGGLVWVKVLGTKSLLVLDRRAVAEVLDRSPSVYAEPELKRRGMSHFQPESLTLSRGEAWDDRRRFTEEVLDTGHEFHQHAASFLEVVHREVADTLAAAAGTLDWKHFADLFGRISRQLLFGPKARSDEGLSATLGAMMVESNRVFALGKSKHFDPFYETLRRYLREPGPNSLASVAARTPTSDLTRVENQIPHWMFALNGTLAANTARTLALIAAHPEIDRRLRDELATVDLDQPHAVARLPLLEGCLQEAMRLWPTTPLLTRQAIADDRLAGEEVPAGTQVLILNLFNHRDRESFPYADRFAPEIWQQPETRELFHHFSGGPQICPGVDLSLLVGKAVLADLLTAHRWVLERPALGDGTPDGGLPYSLDFFTLRWRAEPSETPYTAG